MNSFFLKVKSCSIALVFEEETNMIDKVLFDLVKVEVDLDWNWKFCWKERKGKKREERKFFMWKSRTFSSSNGVSQFFDNFQNNKIW